MNKCFVIISLSVISNIGCVIKRNIEGYSVKTIRNVRVFVPYLKSDIVNSKGLGELHCLFVNSQPLLICKNSKRAQRGNLIKAYAFIDERATIDSFRYESTASRFGTPDLMQPLLYKYSQTQIIDSVRYYSFRCDIEYVQLDQESYDYREHMDKFCLKDSIGHGLEIFNVPPMLKYDKKCIRLTIQRIILNSE